MQLIDRQTQARVSPCGCVLFKEAIKRQRVLHLGRRQLEQLGHLDNGLQGYVPQMFVHHVQRWQRHGLFRRIARKETP